MKIVVDQDIPFIEGRFPASVEALYLPASEITPDRVKEADAIVVRTRTRCDRRLLENSKVRLIATATIGTDHIDKNWCNSNGIKIASAPGCNAPGVVQYVYASLLSSGFDPSNHTIGIIGYGNVGKLIGEWAHSLGIKILINDPPLQENNFMEEKENRGDFVFSDLDTLLQNSDAVTLHVPLTAGGKYPTLKLIGGKELNKMKSGAILINSSRGGVVEERALKEAISNRSIKAIIDVWENEPYIDRTLLEMVEIGTPHIAGYSLEGKKRGTRMALEAISEFFNLQIDFDGLSTPSLYSPQHILTPDTIQASYNPVADSEKLKRDPSSFESLRNSYSYRQELN